MRRPQSVLLFVLSCAGAYGAERAYEAQIRRTSYGVPHVQARDFGSLGFGEGYAQAEDHLCTVADQVVKARGERSKYFGAGNNDEHLRNDIAMKALGMVERGSGMLAKQPQELGDSYGR